MAVDPFSTGDDIPANPASPLLGHDALPIDACHPPASGGVLSLADVENQALCANPKSRAAWADVKAASAGVGAAIGAYLPTVEGAWQRINDHSANHIDGFPKLSTSQSGPYGTASLSLNWVLLDFGVRSAGLESAQKALFAAQAQHDAQLQVVFENTAKDFYAVQAARAQQLSAQRIEDAAKQSLDAATARVEHGVAPITDQLQAQTAAAQATFDRAKADGDFRVAQGALAIDMGLMPGTPLSLPDPEDGALPDTSFVHALDELMETARRSHPSVQAAQAQWEASVAKAQVVQRQGRPSVSLIAQSSRNDQPTAGLGLTARDASNRDDYVGVKVQVPMFEGFTRNYQARQAEAQAESQEQNFHDAQQQAAMSVWTAYQQLQTHTDNLRNTDTILQSAQAAFAAAQHRYQSGVGNILELLSVQNTLARAEQQRIQAQTDWRTARLHLAASLGQIGMWALKAQ